MPHITTAMHNSVRRRLGEAMVNSLLGRSITQDVTNSFSSWDSCMNADYCKWPVIAGIVIASLIVLSILTCIGRVCCCGASCCCACFSFLSCCDCCGDSCAGKKSKPHKHLDDPFTNGHAAHRGYQAPPPMMGGALPPPLTAPASGHAAGTLMPLASRRPEPPQYAQFEVGKNGLYVEPKTVELHEDALPPMPSWDGAAKKHVEDEKNAVELQLLEPASGQKMSLAADAATAGTSGPPSPMEGLGNRAGKNGYMGIAGDNYGQQNRSAYSVRHASPGPGMAGQGRGGYGGNPPGGYDGHGQARGFGQDQYGQSTPGGYEAQGRGYDTLPQEGYADGNGFGAAAAAGYGPRNPPLRQYANNQYSTNGRPPPNRQYTGDSSRVMTPGRQYSDQSYGSDNFAQNVPPRGPSRGPDPNGGFNNGPIPRGPSRGPGPNDGYNNNPIPRGPSRGPSPNDAYNHAPLPRGPSRGPSGGPVNNGAPAPNHNSGFDFGIGSTRPSPPPQQRFPPPHQPSFAAELPAHDVQQGYFDNAGTTARRTPPPLETAYPGYRPYAPANKGQGTPSALTPGGREEPERWDPVRQ
ncbi:hypothetical protein LZ554_008143 [Drepanopeziza brunnea f. sp. 'monogermtubi']|nr:hypothetical protein LZ554_008143 [Drepanopeziza brunnea f. sp. 'monogermtubi']